MSQPELLTKVVSALDASGTPYMLTGSYASSLQGEPRLTHDIDLVVAISIPAVSFLLATFSEPDFYLDENAILDAIEHKTQFNLIDIHNGDKVDFWILTDEPFDRSRFERRYQQIFRGRPYYVSTPEDTILMKLRWADMCGGSEKQFNDARGVLELQGKSLDLKYIDQWANSLHLTALWQRLQHETTPESSAE